MALLYYEGQVDLLASSAPGMGDMGGGFSVEPASIDGSAHLLVEIAGLLHEGRLDGDIATMARVPRSHREVGAEAEEFARFADDQYQDLMLLLTGC